MRLTKKIMSLECSECERDLRGGHAEDCSRYLPIICPECGSANVDWDDEPFICGDCEHEWWLDDEE